jgi:hypothetical protein
MARFVQLDHVCGDAIMDAIPLSGMAADDVEIVLLAELPALLRR